MAVAKVACRFGYGDITDMVTTFHVMAEDSFGELDATNLADITEAVEWWFTTDADDFHKLGRQYPSDHFTLYDITALQVSPSVSDPVIRDVNETGGGGLQLMMPPQCCFGLGLRTTVDSRRGRGRMYLPAVQQEVPPFLGEGRVPLYRRQQIVNAGAYLAHRIFVLYDVDGGPFRLAVYSRVDDDAHPVTHFTCSSRFATQRRRAYRPLSYLVGDLTGVDEDADADVP